MRVDGQGFVEVKARNSAKDVPWTPRDESDRDVCEYGTYARQSSENGQRKTVEARFWPAVLKTETYESVQ